MRLHPTTSRPGTVILQGLPCNASSIHGGKAGTMYGVSGAGCLHECLDDSLRQQQQRRAAYVEGQGDVASRLIRGVSTVTIWVTGFLNLLTKAP